MLTLFMMSALVAAADAPAKAPSPPREFRAVWVATVANIDWPSKKGLPAERQKTELLALLDRARHLHLNAVIFQVRPMCDALYRSDLEPWSEYLTGTLGKDPGYDPLEFAVGEAHARGLELHVWFNPYRAHHPSASSPIPQGHLVKRRPDLAPRYGKHHWLVPTSPEVQDHTLAVFLDVTRRYDIDGVHIDDYFYPYKEKDAAGKLLPFPDDASWEAYKKGGGKLARDDWRRDAVNRFVERWYAQTKKLKPHVKVGISPFGIWRPGHPPGIQGFDQYAELYADAKLWLNKGWVDYWTPQLYWPTKQEKQSYPKLLAWWAGENPHGRHLWPGNAAYRVGSNPTLWPDGELAEQVRVTRGQKGASGNVFFSMKALVRKGPVADTLARVYAEPALVPASPWLGKAPPAKPTVSRLERREGLLLDIRPAGQDVRLHVVRQLVGGKWSVDIVPATRSDNRWSSEQKPAKVVVSSIDRVGLESEPVELTP
ncbi:MAG: family 10 glycosylhydrolase [Gemmataceae bacterium]